MNKQQGEMIVYLNGEPIMKEKFMGVVVKLHAGEVVIPSELANKIDKSLRPNIVMGP